MNILVSPDPPDNWIQVRKILGDGKEISISLVFENATYFFHLFKKEVDISTNRFREQQLN